MDYRFLEVLSMASLTVKNIPDELYQHLKQAANAHHRSINSEIIVCLERVFLPQKMTSDEIKTIAKDLRSRVKATTNMDELIQQAKEEGRR
jgi:plasmid stability protein